MSEIEGLKDRDEKAKSELVKVIGKIVGYAKQHGLETFSFPTSSLEAVHIELVRLRAMEADLWSRKVVYVVSYNYGFGEGNGPPTHAFWNASDAFITRRNAPLGLRMDMEIYAVPLWPEPEAESPAEVKEPPSAA